MFWADADKYVIENMWSRHDASNHLCVYETYFSILMTLSVAAISLNAIFAGMLIYGVNKQRHRFLRPWIILHWLIIIFYPLFQWKTHGFHGPDIAMWAIITIILVFKVTIVYSHYEELRIKNDAPIGYDAQVDDNQSVDSLPVKKAYS